MSNILVSDLETIFSVYDHIPEFTKKYSLNDFYERIGDRTYLPLIYFKHNKPVGFKLGYALSEEVFYSWLGGVLPDYRRKGIARYLLQMQEKWAREQGYKYVKVKSMNVFPDMLHMLIDNKYLVEDVEKAPNPMSVKVCFVKKLGK